MSKTITITTNKGEALTLTKLGKGSSQSGSCSWA